MPGHCRLLLYKNDGGKTVGSITGPDGQRCDIVDWRRLPEDPPGTQNVEFSAEAWLWLFEERKAEVARS